MTLRLLLPFFLTYREVSKFILWCISNHLGLHATYKTMKDGYSNYLTENSLFRSFIDMINEFTTLHS